MLILRWIINALIIILVAALVPGISISGIYAALIVALVLGFVNTIIRPLFILLTLPINILSLGLFTLVINALLFWFVASFIKGFEVSGFLAAFLGALILSITSSLVSSFLHKGD